MSDEPHTAGKIRKKQVHLEVEESVESLEKSRYWSCPLSRANGSATIGAGRVACPFSEATSRMWLDVMWLLYQMRPSFPMLSKGQRLGNLKSLQYGAVHASHAAHKKPVP